MQKPVESNLVYWLRREAEERGRSVTGVGEARLIHAKLADGYAQLILQEVGQERRQA